MRATAFATSAVPGGKFRKIWVKPCSVICGADAILIRNENLAGFRRLSDRYGAARIVGADQERAAVTDQALGHNPAVLGLGFGIAIQEFHRRTAGLLDGLGAELVSFAGLLTHEGLDAAEIENDADFRWGALRSADARQNGCSKCSCTGSYNPAAGDGLAFTHAELPLRAMP